MSTKSGSATPAPSDNTDGVACVSPMLLNTRTSDVDSDTTASDMPFAYDAIDRRPPDNSRLESPRLMIDGTSAEDCSWRWKLPPTSATWAQPICTIANLKFALSLGYTEDLVENERQRRFAEMEEKYNFLVELQKVSDQLREYEEKQKEDRIPIKQLGLEEALRLGYSRREVSEEAGRRTLENKAWFREQLRKTLAAKHSELDMKKHGAEVESRLHDVGTRFAKGHVPITASTDICDSTSFSTTENPAMIDADLAEREAYVKSGAMAAVDSEPLQKAEIAQRYYDDLQLRGKPYAKGDPYGQSVLEKAKEFRALQRKSSET